MGTETATCNNSGLWDPDPALLECMFIYVSMPQLSVCCILTYIGVAITGALNVAALSGGVVAIVMVLILLVGIFLLVVTITKKRRSEGIICDMSSIYHLVFVI